MFKGAILAALLLLPILAVSQSMTAKDTAQLVVMNIPLDTQVSVQDNGAILIMPTTPLIPMMRVIDNVLIITYPDIPDAEAEPQDTEQAI